MKTNIGLLLLAATLSLSTAAAAQDTGGRVSFYIGGGQQLDDDPAANDDTPFSIGLMAQSAQNRMVYGFDLASEGTVLDSTYDQNEAANAALSVNALIGTNLVSSRAFRSDIALLVGIREATKDCPDSFLGFACYADQPPTVEYKGNFGAVLTMSFNKVLIGARATTESTQLLVGMRF